MFESYHVISLRKHPFLLALRHLGRFARNVPSGEERGETDVFAGYHFKSEVSSVEHGNDLLVYKANRCLNCDADEFLELGKSCMFMIVCGRRH